MTANPTVQKKIVGSFRDIYFFKYFEVSLWETEWKEHSAYLEVIWNSFPFPSPHLLSFF